MIALTGLFAAAAIGRGDLYLYAFTFLPAAAAIDNVVRLNRVGPDLLVRKLFRRRRSLVVNRCRFGYTPGFRGILRLYLTDGDARIDVGLFMFLGRIRRAVDRLNQSLLDEPTPQTRPALHLVAADQSAMSAAHAAAREYYQRPAWRWTVIAVIAFAVIYSVVGFFLGLFG